MADANQPQRNDPIRDRYYRPLERAETSSDWLFWLAALLSIASLTLDRAAGPKLYDIVQGAFVLCVLVLFFVGQAIRLYWTPRAEDKRRQSLLSDSFGVDITHEKVSGYYTNDQTNPVKRLGASILENSFFSKNIVLRMVHGERFRMAFYAVVWLIAVLNRVTDLALVATIAQVIFGEQIIARWIRMEWLRIRFERVFDNLYRLFQTTSNFNRDEFRVRVLEALGEYETSKGYGGITLSDKIFSRLNANLSLEWEQIRKTLNL